MSESWYVVQTQPCAEEKAKWHLIKQGFASYLPRYRRRVRHARKVQQVLRPLFPSYLFVRLDPQACRWRSINGTIGVRHILTDGVMPRFIDSTVISDIMAREDEAGAVRLARPVFRPGQSVRVTDGPFTDVRGLIEEMRDEDRVVVLLSLLGRKVRTQVSPEFVAAA